jgi:hypothetical protein
VIDEVGEEEVGKTEEYEQWYEQMGETSLLDNFDIITIKMKWYTHNILFHYLELVAGGASTSMFSEIINAVHI